ncbi:MAG TPA: ribosome maturation factor RimM [Dehalococcoidia bacterium]|nr:ribosome maturation factor RimM [Dehalococcoidia bacterium]
MDDVEPGYVAVGRVLSPHGVRGDLKVEPLAGTPDLLAPGHAVTIAGTPRTIERAARRGRLLYVKLAGIDDRETAATLRDRYLQVPESDLQPLAEGEYYRFQLIGLAVRSTQGESLGRVVDVLSTPGNDVFVVQGPQGEVLVPATDDIVREIDIAGGAMTVEVVPGLLPTHPRRR